MKPTSPHQRHGCLKHELIITTNQRNQLRKDSFACSSSSSFYQPPPLQLSLSLSVSQQPCLCRRPFWLCQHEVRFHRGSSTWHRAIRQQLHGRAQRHTILSSEGAHIKICTFQKASSAAHRCAARHLRPRVSNSIRQTHTNNRSGIGNLLFCCTGAHFATPLRVPPWNSRWNCLATSGLESTWLMALCGQPLFALRAGWVLAALAVRPGFEEMILRHHFYGKAFCSDWCIRQENG